jgi:hypothetical protein
VQAVGPAFRERLKLQASKGKVASYFPKEDTTLNQRSDPKTELRIASTSGSSLSEMREKMKRKKEQPEVPQC